MTAIATKRAVRLIYILLQFWVLMQRNADPPTFLQPSWLGTFRGNAGSPNAAL